MYYIGLDLHKKTISYCIKDITGKVYGAGTIEATRQGLDEWMKGLPGPWQAGMEATIFTGWVFDHLKPHGAAVKVAHPLMLRAIAAAKKKNDRVDAATIADCLRCNFLPECYMAPVEIRERRRTLRYRNLLVRQAVQLKNKTDVPEVPGSSPTTIMRPPRVLWFLCQTHRGLLCASWNVWNCSAAAHALPDRSVPGGDRHSDSEPDVT